MDKQLKNMLLCTAFGVGLFAVLMNLDAVGRSVLGFVGLLQPLIVGGVVAFVLNVPMVAIEQGLDKLADKLAQKYPAKKPGAAKRPRSHRGMALLLTVLLLVLILGIVSVVVVPQFVVSFTEGIRQLQASLPKIEQLMTQLGIDAVWLEEFDISQISTEWLQKLTSGVGQASSVLLGTVSSVAGRLVDLTMALVFSAYFLLDKERLARQAQWALFKLCPAPVAQKIVLVANRLRLTYASFLSGQCVEACVLGLMMFAAFTVFQLPYAGLVAVLTAVTSIIPYVGSFVSCAVAVVLILLINPIQALIALIVYQIVQFCENQFIYPRVVGNAVGLPPLYTILAVFLGGKLFGVVGMIFFIPLMATVYLLLKEAQQGADDAPAEPPQPDGAAAQTKPAKP